MDTYFYSGGYDGSSARNNILEYDPETDKWTEVGTMREARYRHAVSVVDLRNYADYCHFV